MSLVDNWFKRARVLLGVTSSRNDFQEFCFLGMLLSNGSLTTANLKSLKLISMQVIAVGIKSGR